MKRVYGRGAGKGSSRTTAQNLLQKKKRNILGNMHDAVFICTCCYCELKFLRAAPASYSYAEDLMTHQNTITLCLIEVCWKGSSKGEKWELWWFTQLLFSHCGFLSTFLTHLLLVKTTEIWIKSDFYLVRNTCWSETELTLICGKL